MLLPAQTNEMKLSRLLKALVSEDPSAFIALVEDHVRRVGGRQCCVQPPRNCLWPHVLGPHSAYTWPPSLPLLSHHPLNRSMVQIM